MTRISASIAGAALALFPALAPAQSSGPAFAYHDWTGTGGRMSAKPICTYKGAMSDAEIKLCVGHAVHYSYAPEAADAAPKAPQRPAGSG